MLVEEDFSERHGRAGRGLRGHPIQLSFQDGLTKVT